MKRLEEIKKRLEESSLDKAGVGFDGYANTASEYWDYYDQDVPWLVKENEKLHDMLQSSTVKESKGGE